MDGAECLQNHTKYPGAADAFSFVESVLLVFIKSPTPLCTAYRVMLPAERRSTHDSRATTTMLPTHPTHPTHDVALPHLRATKNTHYRLCLCNSCLSIEAPHISAWPSIGYLGRPSDVQDPSKLQLASVPRHLDNLRQPSTRMILEPVGEKKSARDLDVNGKMRSSRGTSMVVRLIQGQTKPTFKITGITSVEATKRTGR